MPACRLIFRLDFDLNYDIVDQPGNIMRLIDQVAGSEISNIAENQSLRGVAGKYVSQDHKVVSEFSVQPTNIVAWVEMVDGIDLKDIMVDKRFLLLAKLTDEVCEQFNINEIRRSGVRVFYFSKVQKDENSFSAYRSFINNELISGIEKCLGPIQDYGVIFDGESDQKIKYHCRSGPLKEKENYLKYFQTIGAKVSEYSIWDYIIDIDLYEQNIALSKISFRKWFRPQIEKATELINIIESRIEKSIGN